MIRLRLSLNQQTEFRAEIPGTGPLNGDTTYPLNIEEFLFIFDYFILSEKGDIK